MKLSWGARVWKWGSWALLSVGLAALIANWEWIVDALKSRFPGKGLWDYLEILLVPVLIFGLGVLLDWRSKARDILQIQQAEKIRQEESKDQALQLYFDRISSILIDKQVISLAEAAKKLGPEYKDPLVESARDVIRAQTLAILRVFSADEEKKSSVVRFLIESEILSSLAVSLSGADLSLANLSRANLIGANLNEANLSGADLRRADLREANLSLANLSGANFSETNLCEADLSRTNLTKVNLSVADLSRANLSRANLNEANLCGANLSGADLSLAKLIRADLSLATLSEADISVADLSEADLSGANLSRADLSVANLSAVNFRSANLSGANLSRANLIGADLSGASLFGADLEEVRWDDKTIWPIADMFGVAAKNIPPALKKQLGL